MGETVKAENKTAKRKQDMTIYLKTKKITQKEYLNTY